MNEKLKKALQQVRSIQQQNSELEKSEIYLDYKNIWITFADEDGTKFEIRASIDMLNRNPPDIR